MPPICSDERFPVPRPGNRNYTATEISTEVTLSDKSVLRSDKPEASRRGGTLKSDDSRMMRVYLTKLINVNARNTAEWAWTLFYAGRSFVRGVVLSRCLAFSAVTSHKQPAKLVLLRYLKSNLAGIVPVAPLAICEPCFQRPVYASRLPRPRVPLASWERCATILS